MGRLPTNLVIKAAVNFPFPYLLFFTLLLSLSNVFLWKIGWLFRVLEELLTNTMHAANGCSVRLLLTVRTEAYCIRYYSYFFLSSKIKFLWQFDVIANFVYVNLKDGHMKNRKLPRAGGSYMFILTVHLQRLVFAFPVQYIWALPFSLYTLLLTMTPPDKEVTDNITKSLLSTRLQNQQFRLEKEKKKKKT